MAKQSLLLAFLLSSCHLLSLSPGPARADGGTVRLRERAGDYQIAVFTSPTPFRAGPVDISALIQDAATGECVPEVRVTVRLKAPGSGCVLEYLATSEAATNKLFRAAEFELPEPGWWDVTVAVEGTRGPAVVQFGLQADEPPPRWLDLWPWFCWPTVAIALFGIHRVLLLRKASPAGNGGPPTINLT